MNFVTDFLHVFPSYITRKSLSCMQNSDMMNTNLSNIEHTWTSNELKRVHLLVIKLEDPFLNPNERTSNIVQPIPRYTELGTQWTDSNIISAKLWRLNSNTLSLISNETNRRYNVRFIRWGYSILNSFIGTITFSIFQVKIT